MLKYRPGFFWKQFSACRSLQKFYRTHFKAVAFQTSLTITFALQATSWALCSDLSDFGDFTLAEFRWPAPWRYVKTCIYFHGRYKRYGCGGALEFAKERESWIVTNNFVM